MSSVGFRSVTEAPRWLHRHLPASGAFPITESAGRGRPTNDYPDVVHAIAHQCLHVDPRDLRGLAARCCGQR